MPEVNQNKEKIVHVNKSRDGNWLNKEFSASALLFWIKNSISIDYRFVHINERNVILGLFPAGNHKQNIPLKNITNVTLNTNYKIFRFIFGFCFAITGLSVLSSSPVVGIIVAAFGIALFMNGILTQLLIEKGGTSYIINVPFFNKQAILEVQQAIEQALATDADKTDQSLYHNRLQEEDQDDIQ